MCELKILATSKKNLSHTCSQQPPVSLPPIWPPFRTLGFFCKFLANSIEIGLEKYDWTAMLEIQMNMWPGRGGQMGGARWPNRGKGDRGLLWASVWKNFFRSGQNLQFTHGLFQFYQAFATKNFVGWENDSQSWNPCFLGVRSPNQLPKASWLGNLTRKKQIWPSCGQHKSDQNQLHKNTLPR